MSTASISASGTQEQVALQPAVQRYSPEFRLLLLCMQWPLSDASLLDLARSATEVSDWDHLLRIALRHRVLGLVARSLQQARVRIPGEAGAAFQKLSMQAAREALLLAVESLRLSSLLEAGGVDALFLKGPAVAALAYHNVSIRHAKDIDLLVPRQDAEAAMAILRAAGYLPVFDLDAAPADRRALWFRYAKSMDWVHPASGTQLELHWRLTDLSPPESALPTAARQRVALVPNRTLSTLEPDRLLAYLCVHGAAHGWMRLKWLADVHALLPSEDGDACEAAFRRLLRMGAGRSAAQALLLCHDLLHLPLPERLLRQMRRDWVLQVLRRSALRLLARGGETKEVDDLPFGTTSVYLSRLLLGSGPQSLLLELRTWGFRPDELLKTRLPRPLLFLFPLLRLGTWLGGRLRYGGRSPHTR